MDYSRNQQCVSGDEDNSQTLFKLKSFIKQNLKSQNDNIASSTDSSFEAEMTSYGNARAVLGTYVGYTDPSEPQPMIRSDVTMSDRIWLKNSLDAEKNNRTDLSPPLKALNATIGAEDWNKSFHLSDTESEHSYSSQDTMIMKGSRQSRETKPPTAVLQPRNKDLHTGAVPIAMSHGLERRRSSGRLVRQPAMNEDPTLNVQGSKPRRVAFSDDVRDNSNNRPTGRQGREEEGDDGYESTDNLSSGTNSSSSSTNTSLARHSAHNGVVDPQSKAQSSKANSTSQKGRIPSFRDMNTNLRRQAFQRSSTKQSSPKLSVTQKMRDLYVSDDGNTDTVKQNNPNDKTHEDSVKGDRVNRQYHNNVVPIHSNVPSRDRIGNTFQQPTCMGETEKYPNLNRKHDQYGYIPSNNNCDWTFQGAQSQHSTQYLDSRTCSASTNNQGSLLRDTGSSLSWVPNKDNIIPNHIVDTRNDNVFSNRHGVYDTVVEHDSAGVPSLNLNNNSETRVSFRVPSIKLNGSSGYDTSSEVIPHDLKTGEHSGICKEGDMYSLGKSNTVEGQIHLAGALPTYNILHGRNVPETVKHQQAAEIDNGFERHTIHVSGVPVDFPRNINDTKTFQQQFPKDSSVLDSKSRFQQQSPEDHQFAKGLVINSQPETVDYSGLTHTEGSAFHHPNPNTRPKPIQSIRDNAFFKQEVSGAITKDSILPPAELRAVYEKKFAQYDTRRSFRATKVSQNPQTNSELSGIHNNTNVISNTASDLQGENSAQSHNRHSFRAMPVGQSTHLNSEFSVIQSNFQSNTVANTISQNAFANDKYTQYGTKDSFRAKEMIQSSELGSESANVPSNSHISEAIKSSSSENVSELRAACEKNFAQYGDNRHSFRAKKVTQNLQTNSEKVTNSEIKVGRDKSADAGVAHVINPNTMLQTPYENPHASVSREPSFEENVSKVSDPTDVSTTDEHNNEKYTVREYIGSDSKKVIMRKYAKTSAQSNYYGKKGHRKPRVMAYQGFKEVMQDPSDEQPPDPSSIDERHRQWLIEQNKQLEEGEVSGEGTTGSKCSSSSGCGTSLRGVSNAEQYRNDVRHVSDTDQYRNGSNSQYGTDSRHGCNIEQKHYRRDSHSEQYQTGSRRDSNDRPYGSNSSLKRISYESQYGAAYNGSKQSSNELQNQPTDSGLKSVYDQPYMPVIDGSKQSGTKNKYSMTGHGSVIRNDQQYEDLKSHLEVQGHLEGGLKPSSNSHEFGALSPQNTQYTTWAEVHRKSPIPHGQYDSDVGMGHGFNHQAEPAAAQQVRWVDIKTIMDDSDQGENHAQSGFKLLQTQKIKYNEDYVKYMQLLSDFQTKDKRHIDKDVDNKSAKFVKTADIYKMLEEQRRPPSRGSRLISPPTGLAPGGEDCHQGATPYNPALVVASLPQNNTDSPKRKQTFSSNV